MGYDVGLDPLTGDFRSINVHITGTELVVQRITSRLRLFTGEYILNQFDGLPYLQIANESPANPQAFGALVRTKIGTTPGVSRIDTFETIVDGETWRFEGAVVIAAEDGTDAERIALGIDIDLTGGNSTPVIVTYHRLGRISP